MSEFGDGDLVVDRMSRAPGNVGDAVDDEDELLMGSEEFGDGGHGVIASKSSMYEVCNVLDRDDLGDEWGILVVLVCRYPPPGTVLV